LVLCFFKTDFAIYTGTGEHLFTKASTSSSLLALVIHTTKKIHFVSKHVGVINILREKQEMALVVSHLYLNNVAIFLTLKKSSNLAK
jgi:hypothetical protein